MQNEEYGFDNELFGLLLKRERANRYRRVDEFVAAVKEKTGRVISKDSYYKYEKGTMKLATADVMAINLTLFGRMNAPEYWRMVYTAAPREWNDIEEDAERERIDHIMNSNALS